MHNVIRLSPTVTLRLSPRPDGALRLKLRPKTSRPALGGITNVVDSPPRSSDTDADKLSAESRAPPKPSPAHSSQFSRVVKAMPRRLSPPGPFKELGRVGKGTFGDAVAVHDMRGLRGAQGRPLCLKIFQKKKIIKAEKEYVIVQELLAYQALSACATDKWLPFVMRLEASMEDAHRVVFAMELMNGDLFSAMMHWDHEIIAIHKKQWLAQMATGLTAIHFAGIIHRDIKPENILIDFANNIRISDFGSCYVSPTPTSLHSFGEYSLEVTGTCQYQAPEMVANIGLAEEYMKKYSIAVDYWSLGCLAYELETCDAAGSKPLFQSRAALKDYVSYQPVRNSGKRYKKFERLSGSALSLISGLLRPSPSYRYRHADLRRHEYFYPKSTGHSEFYNIETRGKDLNSLTYKGDVSDTILGMREKNVKIYMPVPYLAKGKPAGHSLDNLGWINPKGIWSPAYDDPARYETPPTTDVSDTDLEGFDAALSLNA